MVKIGKCRILDVAPCDWDLSEHRWTKHDAEVARAIKVIYPGAVRIRKDENKPGSTVLGDILEYNSSITIDTIALRPGEEVLLDDIIMEGEA